MSTSVRYYPGGQDSTKAQQNRAELWDGAAGTYTSWDTSGAQTSSRALTANEASVLAAQDSALTVSTNASILQSRAAAALNANATYLALAAPINTQVFAQVALLTKECNALIRLLLSQTDTTAGT